MTFYKKPYKPYNKKTPYKKSTSSYSAKQRDGTYKCRDCNRDFQTKGGFQSHLKMVKNTGSHYPKKRNY